MGREFDKKKFKERDEEYIGSINRLTKKAKKYKPEELKITKAKPLTSDDLPDRPEKPKMPTLKIPNNSLRSDSVAKPSGLPGTQNKYSTKTATKNKIKSTYKDAPTKGVNNLVKFKQKAQGTYKEPKPTKPAPVYLPTGKVTKNKPFGEGTTKYAPGVSLGQKPNKNKPKPFGNRVPNTPNKPLAKKRIKNQLRKADLDNKITTNELAKIKGIARRNNIGNKFVSRQGVRLGQQKYGNKGPEPKPKGPTPTTQTSQNPFGRETSSYAPGASLGKPPKAKNNSPFSKKK